MAWGSGGVPPQGAGSGRVRPVADVAEALGISDQTIHSWRRHDRIDKGLEPGLTSGEKSEPAAAEQRIAASRPLPGCTVDGLLRRPSTIAASRDLDGGTPRLGG